MNSTQLWVALLGVLAPACGYRFGLTLPDRAETVAVEIFANDTRLRDLERDFHQELTQSLSRRVSARLVSVREADLVVRGRLIDFSRRSGIRSTDNELLESGVLIAVEARLERRRPEGEPELLTSASHVAESGYLLDDPRLIGGTESELEARERALRNLADRLVMELFEPVSYE